MAFVRFVSTPLGRGLRILGGLLLLAYGVLTLSLWGIVGMMVGVVALVTGLAGLPHPPVPRDRSG